MKGKVDQHEQYLQTLMAQYNKQQEMLRKMDNGEEDDEGGFGMATRSTKKLEKQIQFILKQMEDIKKDIIPQLSKKMDTRIEDKLTQLKS